MFDPITNNKLAKLAGLRYDCADIQPGPIVYSRTHEVRRQFGKLSTFPRCVLITSFSDACVTPDMAAALPANVVRWFSNNVRTNNPRVVAVPIGIRHSPEVEKAFDKAVKIGKQPRKNLVYMNFMRRGRGTKQRKGIYEQFAGKDWVTTKGGWDHVPVDEFYNDLATHDFCISPPGAGPDCHRHWEALALGCVPIVLPCAAVRSVLSGLPVLWVKHWGELYEEGLRRAVPFFQKSFATPMFLRQDMNYWRARIQEEVDRL